MSRFHTTTIPTDADYYIHKMGEVRSIRCVRALVIKSKSIRCIKDVQNWRVSGFRGEQQLFTPFSFIIPAVTKRSIRDIIKGNYFCFALTASTESTLARISSTLSQV